MAVEWRNWAGDQVCTPLELATPATRDELATVIARARLGGQRVRVAGAGHSFTEAALTDGTMVSLARMDRLLDADPATGLVRVEAGIQLHALNERLWDLGLAMENLGDIDVQSLAGAISTATHGTGSALRNISAQVEAVELMTAEGEVRELSGGDELRAARVSLGALGVITAVTLRTVPAFTLHRVDSPQPLADVLARFEEVADANDHFELFVFPYTERALVIERNRTEDPPKPPGRAAAWLNDVLLENITLDLLARTGRRFRSLNPRLARVASRLLSHSERRDRSYRIFATERRVRFTEMEYALPREHGPEALRRVLELIRERRVEVFFPIEFRVVAGDDALLSPTHERPSAYIAVHQYNGMQWRGYFEAVETIMRSYGGRPHWGKRHFQDAASLAQVYPRFADFQAVRDEYDPKRLFANEYTERVLGP
ncbi:MAG: L-gulono,4-lactone dehydrogenase [Solirubrobacterales bacterium]|nr:L-gulono,4-lactone dehydrogenase [Solirubrobacterales bacterium]